LFTPIIPAAWKAKIGSVVVQAQPEQKVSETPISTNKPGMVAPNCNHSYLGGVGRRIAIQELPQAKIGDTIKK
jgi:hypothetical protein